MNIVLIGGMGAGKTTLGRLLAQRLSMPFYDSDQQIEHQVNASIHQIFHWQGEQAFRQYETRILERLTQRNHCVLATGGGAVLSADNRRLLSNRGLVIYLKLDFEVQWQRVSHRRGRPLLQRPDAKQFLQKTMVDREKFYQQTADHVVCWSSHQDKPATLLEALIALVDSYHLGRA